MMAESECPYFKAKGMHLFVLHVFQGQPRGEVCQGCGVAA